MGRLLICKNGLPHVNPFPANDFVLLVGFLYPLDRLGQPKTNTKLSGALRLLLVIRRFF